MLLESHLSATGLEASADWQGSDTAGGGGASAGWFDNGKYHFPGLTRSETTEEDHSESARQALARLKHDPCTELPPLGVGTGRALHGTNTGMCLCARDVEVPPCALSTNEFAQVSVNGGLSFVGGAQVCRICTVFCQRLSLLTCFYLFN